MSVSRGPRERLIDAAIALVRERGVEGTGLAELLERSGTARRSIYQHFPGGKYELVGVATDAAGSSLREMVRDGAATMATADLLVVTVEQMKASLVSSDFRLGCPVAAAALAPADAVAVREAAGVAFDGWVSELEELLSREGRPPAAARSLAGFLVSAIEGALLAARATRSVEPLDQAREQLALLLAD